MALPSTARVARSKPSNTSGAPVRARPVGAVGAEDALVHLVAGGPRGVLTRRRVGEQRERTASDGGVAIFVGQDPIPVESGRLGIDVGGERDERREALARLRLARELKHGELLQGGPRATGDQPVEE